jgi:thymidylate synthase
MECVTILQADGRSKFVQIVTNSVANRRKKNRVIISSFAPKPWLETTTWRHVVIASGESWREITSRDYGVYEKTFVVGFGSGGDDDVSDDHDVQHCHPESQYLDLLRELLEVGEGRDDRTGNGVRSLFGRTMTFDLRSSLPVLTTKRIFVRGVIEELRWIVSGSSDATELSEKRIRIWEHNTSRAFLDSVGLDALNVGDTGPLYGHTLRHCGAVYRGKDADYAGQGVDQLARVIASLKDDPCGRRHVISLWNPVTIGQSVLPPCHGVAVQFFVSRGTELSCTMYQRSVDAFLGLPFNIASYAILTCMVAKVCGYTAGDLTIDLGDVHVYEPHVEAARLQITRRPLPFPRLWLADARAIEDFLEGDTIRVDKYMCEPGIKAEIC